MKKLFTWFTVIYFFLIAAFLIYTICIDTARRPLNYSFTIVTLPPAAILLLATCAGLWKSQKWAGTAAMVISIMMVFVVLLMLVSGLPFYYILHATPPALIIIGCRLRYIE